MIPTIIIICAVGSVFLVAALCDYWHIDTVRIGFKLILLGLLFSSACFFCTNWNFNINMPERAVIPYMVAMPIGAFNIVMVLGSFFWLISEEKA